ncbi:MAG: hypothetical protein AAGA54_33310, partial [Myxococcota bacterium]
MNRAPALLAAALLLVACGDDAPPSADAGTSSTQSGTSTAADASTSGETTDADASSSTGEEGLAFDLSDGAQVRVRDDGAVSIWRGDRRVFALRSDPKPQGRRFTETFGGGIGLWTVERADAESVPAEMFVEATLENDVVSVDYLDAEGQPFTLAITVRTPGETLHITSSSDNDFDAIALPLDCDEAASFHGFGEQYSVTDQRGSAFRLWLSEQGIGRNPDFPLLPVNGDLHTTYFPMPYYLDARGFGGLFQTPMPVEVDLCSSDPDAAWFEVQGAVDLIVFSGPTGYDVIRQLGDEVGRPTLPPAWAWQPWIGMQGGQDDVAAEVARLEMADVPYSA